MQNHSLQQRLLPRSGLDTKQRPHPFPWTRGIRAWWVLCPEARLVELLSALCALWWALLIAQPGDLFASNVSFAGLAARGGEARWGLFFAAGAGVHLAALFAGPPLLRFLALAVSSAVWAGVASALAAGAKTVGVGLPQNTGCGVYGSLALVEIVAMGLLARHIIADARAVLRRWKANAA